MKRVPIKLREPIIFDKQFKCPYDKPFGYIYKVTNLINGHMYIGKHKYDKPYIDPNYFGSGEILLKAYIHYGKENFSIEILEWIATNDSDLNKAEIKWIDAFSTFEFPQHYNMTPGGDGVSLPGELNPMYGVKLTGEKNPMYGKTHTSQVKKKLSELRKGKPSPMKGKHRKSESNELQRQKMIGKLAGEKNYFYGKHYTGKTNPFAKSMVQLSLDDKLIRVFSYIGEAQKYGFDSHYTCRCCRGERESFKGFKFMYLSDYEEKFGPLRTPITSAEI